MIHRPSRLHFAETHKVTDVACGYGFSAFAVDSKEHQLFGTGINTDSQIGYHAVRRGHPLGLLLAPVPISRFPPVHSSKGGQKSDRVAGLAAGRAHLLVLMASGCVYSFGSNHYGQCGHPSSAAKEPHSLYLPHCISKAPDGSKFLSVECGQDHSLFLSDQGEVWACGWGADGQMGQGDTQSSWKLKKAVGDLQGKRIIKISSSADTILALSEDGEVVGWGNNEYGQLITHNPTPQLSTPTQLKFPSKVGRVKDVAAGGSFCLLTNDSGEVFVWGYGLLGLGPSADHAKEPVQVPPTLFGAGVFQEQPRVTKVAAGLSYSVAVLANGDMYSWGHNSLGCLGLGHTKDQSFPMKVAVGAEVVKVSCGVDHLLALCKPFV
ncbi:RCC1-like G exchanging factor-like protein isoform X2 [Ischnura elegans]|nr:RCC1-like G exchanging factor-like protein isoform X2 [Ischnura elegans]